MTYRIEDTDTETWKRVIDPFNCCVAYADQQNNGMWILSDNITGERLTKQMFRNINEAVEWIKEQADD